LALASFYNIPNMPIFYLVGFGVAGLFSPARQRVSLRGALRDFVTDPVSLLPNVSLLVGLGLNLAGVRPGAWIDSVNTYLVPTFTLFSMFAVGMTMTFRRTRDYVRPILGQAAIKYLFWPALTFALIYTLRGNLLHDPITYRVLVLQACMPVAMQAMLLSNLFDLDMDLVNALWLTTTLFSLVTAPLLIYALQL
jgi:predicted permease